MESGDLVMLGVMDNVRNDVFPDVPTCEEQGFDIFYATQRGMALPLGVDDEIVETLREACAAAIEDEEFAATMASLGQKIDYLDGPAYGEYLEQAAIDVPAAMVSVGLVEEDA